MRSLGRQPRDGCDNETYFCSKDCIKNQKLYEMIGGLAEQLDRA